MTYPGTRTLRRPWLILLAALWAAGGCSNGGGVVPIPDGWRSEDTSDDVSIRTDVYGPDSCDECDVPPVDLVPWKEISHEISGDVLDDVADDVPTDTSEDVLDDGSTDLVDAWTDHTDDFTDTPGDVPPDLPCADWFADDDGDGWGAGAPACLWGPDEVYTTQTPGDCDDGNPDIHPDAEELCDGIDDDCDDEVDEGAPCPELVYYCDEDDDGAISEIASGVCWTFDCVPDGCGLEAGDDCEDGDAGVHPVSPEICNDLDEDCDGFVDEDGACPVLEYYCDIDEDGAVSDTVTDSCDALACVPLGCQEEPGADCDDGDVALNPWAAEFCNGIDDDCDDVVDEDGACPEIPYYCDTDEDGAISGSVTWSCAAFQCIPEGCQGSPGEDCDDDDGAIHPAAHEVCNGVDDDCQAGPDDGDTCPEIPYYCDGDEDEAVSAEPSGSCDSFACVPEGCQDVPGPDCADGDDGIHPGVEEVCNGVDDDCADGIDDGDVCPAIPFYCDMDEDGAISVEITASCAFFECLPDGCENTPGTDCDDEAFAIHPGADEICNGLDDDCLEGPDDGDVCPVLSYYCDEDDDQHFSETVSGTCDSFACIPKTCVEAPGADCEDGDPAVAPGLEELCNGIDDDCTGEVDQGGVCPVVSYHCDGDGDGHVSAVISGSCDSFECIPEACGTDPGGDCDDIIFEINPGVDEVCNGIDDDCAGGVDDGDVCPVLTYHCDMDEDGWFSESVTDVCAAFECVPAACQEDPGQDCNDNQPLINTDADEVCNGIDDNCAQGQDEDAVCPTVTYYCDTDEDDHLALDPTGTCDWFSCLPDGCSEAQGDDCHDGNGAINPSAEEDCLTEVSDDCDDDTNPPDALNCVPHYPDPDEDGFAADDAPGLCLCEATDTHPTSDQGDCGEGDGAVHPGALEICNELDDDCDGALNEGDICEVLTFFCDGDGDQHISAAPSGTCEIPGCVPEGCVLTPGTDCEDGSADIHPDAVEDCATPADDNCDSETDADDAVSCTVFRRDHDGDDYGVADDTLCRCAPFGEYSASTELPVDCNDQVASIHPGADEVCDGVDQNCDEEPDEGDVCPTIPYYCDQDGDDAFSEVSTGSCDSFQCTPADCVTTPGGDCNDNMPGIHPGAAELCNGKDDDCDDEVDDGAPCPTLTYYCDVDADNHIAEAPTDQCDTYLCVPPGCQETAGADCNDGNPGAYPGASEVCNGEDDDCDETPDGPGVCPPIDYYCDGEGDGYRSSLPSDTCDTYACVPEDCQTGPGPDCNDADPDVNPGVTEVCDGLDEDCSGVPDEGACPVLYYHCDGDDDGYVSAAVSADCQAFQCIPAECQADPGDDCNDGDGSIRPGGVEVCDGVDEDCDGEVDEGGICPFLIYYCDGDEDGHIGTGLGGFCSAFQCVPEGCQEEPGEDCDDWNPVVYPGAAKVCDGVDNDCDDEIDEEDICPVLEYSCDGDGDGYAADALSGSCAAFQCIPEDCQEGLGDDCQDGDGGVHPGAAELCNGEDEDCDDLVDEGGVCPTVSYYCDDDGDGAFSKTPTATCDTFQCIPADCQDVPGSDCDDSTGAIGPTVTEDCDTAWDDNCNGLLNEDDAVGCEIWLLDGDGDGYAADGAETRCLCGAIEPHDTSVAGDCNDGDASIHPGVSDAQCDGVDDDCDAADDDGACWIDGSCVVPGTFHPEDPCLHCDPLANGVGWSVADGGPCDDGLSSTVDDVCSGGNCSGVPAPCFDLDPFGDAGRVQSLLIGVTGHPGQGLDVDFDPTTCAPTGSFLDGTPKCSGGVDNAFSVLGDLLNVQLDDQNANGGYHMLLEFRDWTGDGAPFPIGFISGAVASPPCDYTLPGCDYLASLAYLDGDCMPVTGFENSNLSGTDLLGGASPGDLDHVFILSMPITDGATLDLVIYWARLEGTVTISNGSITAFEGFLGGAIIKEELLGSLETLPDDFFDEFGFSKEGIIGLIGLLLTNDIDLDGDGIHESVSIGFVIDADEADIVGVY